MSSRREDRDPEGAETDALLSALRAQFEGHVHNVEVVRDTGSVIARDGRKLDFMPSAVRLAGSVTKMEALRPGQPVTFDVSQTAAGPRISRLWTGEGPWQGGAAE
jgi:hypothetical protein